MLVFFKSNFIHYQVLFTVKRSFHSSFLPCCSVFCQFYILIICLCCQLSGVKHDVIWWAAHIQLFFLILFLQADGKTEIIVIFKCRYGADEPAATMSSFQLYHREIFTQGFPPIICLYCEVNRSTSYQTIIQTHFNQTMAGGGEASGWSLIVLKLWENNPDVQLM